MSCSRNNHGIDIEGENTDSKLGTHPPWISLGFIFSDGLVGLSPTSSRNVAQVARDHYGCAVLEKGLSHGKERQVCYGSEHVGMHGVAQTYLPLNWMNL